MRNAALMLGVCVALLALWLASPRVQPTWHPPKTTIDSNYVEVVRSLLGHGLGDPRGGQFSRVKLHLGDAAFGRHDSSVAYGWALPGNKIVAVDGLTYSFDRYLGDARVDQFVHSSLRRDQMRSPVPVAEISPATPALLLAAGHTSLAEESYSYLRRRSSSTPKMLFKSLMDRCMMQVAECLRSHNDGEALSWALQLKSLAVKRRAEGHEPEVGNHWPNPLVITDSDVEKLLIDVQRRVQSAKPPLDVDKLNGLSQSDRIKTLLEHLDDVQRQSVLTDSIVAALAREGLAAVPGLIATIETDNRLSRVVTDGRDFFPERKFVPVRQVAELTLYWAWPESHTLTKGQGGGRVAALTYAWQKWNQFSRVRQCLESLRAQNGSESLTSAKYLVEVDSNGSLRGEPLRAAYGREISDLLKGLTYQTIHSLSPNPQTPNPDPVAVATALEMAHCFFVWDPSSVQNVLQIVCEDTLAIYEAQNDDGQLMPGVNKQLTQIVFDRLAIGDASALPDLAKVAFLFVA